MKAGTKVRVLRGTWAGQEGVVKEIDTSLSNYRNVMTMIGGVEVELEGGKTVQLPKNNLEAI